jgi:hypothetical protein
MIDAENMSSSSKRGGSAGAAPLLADMDGQSLHSLPDSTPPASVDSSGLPYLVLTPSHAPSLGHSAINSAASLPQQPPRGSGKQGVFRGSRASAFSSFAHDPNEHRIVQRNRPFGQSAQRLNMERTSHYTQAFKPRHDFFHSVLTMRIWTLLLVVILGNIAIVTIYAMLYMLIDGHDCDVLGFEWKKHNPHETPTVFGNSTGQLVRSFRSALAFSIETYTTIGYDNPGSSEAYFYGCWSYPLLVLTQCLIYIVMTAVLAGIVFARVARPNNNAHQIVFSDKACIRCVDGSYHFLVQIAEASFRGAKYHPTVEGHVRVVAILHETTQPDPSRNIPEEQLLFQTRLMRLMSPDDDTGAMLFLPTPQVITHMIDRWSPLFPPSVSSPAAAHEPAKRHKNRFFHIVRRQHDLPSNLPSRGNMAWQLSPSSEPDSPDLCTTGALGARELAARDAAQERPQDRPRGSERCSGSGLSEANSEPSEPRYPSGKVQGRFREGEADSEPSEPRGGGGGRRRGSVGSAAAAAAVRMGELISDHLHRAEVEVVVVFEGTEPLSGMPFQARQSYTAKDIVFDRTFSPCMRRGEDGRAVLDWAKFHDLRKPGSDEYE